MVSFLFPCSTAAERTPDGGSLKPSEAQLLERAEAWRPWRGVAAHLLWAYYGGIKRGEIASTILNAS